jgi:Mn-dependent DtxR family transcriptional regulator
MVKKFTGKQGQYLSFIYRYIKLNGQSPAEADIQKYFKVSPPTVHQMVVKLESIELIKRKAGVARSIQILVDPENIPDLQ